jgi:nitrogen regulatory protein PII
MTKVEVVVTGAEAPAVRELCRSVGATGWTGLSGVSGLGHHGLHQGRLLFNEHDTLELLITVVPDERADALVAGLRELLEQASGVMFVSETWVSRPEHFR